MSDEATWRELIKDEMESRGDTWGASTICTLDDDGLDKKFDSGFGGSEGEPFTLWTDNYVYFPVVYDGAESCGSVPRNPGYPHGTPNKHVGG